MANEYVAQADTLFKFLREAFRQMPRWVQVIAYFALLSLFIFLVVYPLLGITYFRVKIEPVIPGELRAQWPCENPKESHRWPQCLTKGLKVIKEDHAYTNDNGYFTFPVRMVNVPMFQRAAEKFLGYGIEFEIEDARQGVVASPVVIPAPTAFLAFFRVNPQKVFYAPTSQMSAEQGMTRRFFMSFEEAWKAAKEARPKTAGSDIEPPPASSSRMRPATSGWVDTAVAAEQSYEKPSFTLRIHRIQLVGAEGSSRDIYFGIKVDGKERDIEGVASKRSAYADHLSVVAGEWKAVGGIDIPILSGNSRVTIDVFATAGWFRARDVGSITVAPESRVLQKAKGEGRGVAVEWELLPPIGVGAIGLATDDGQIRSANWLEVPESFSPKVLQCAWVRHVGLEPVLSEHFCYGRSTRMRPGALATAQAQVLFEGGSALRLSARWVALAREPKTLPELYAAIDIARNEGKAEQALAFSEQALKVRSDAPAWIWQLKGAVLRDLERLAEAAGLYREALNRTPNDLAARTGYALTLAEWSDAGQPDLLEAKRSLEDLLKNKPPYVWGQIALGALQARVGDTAAAIKTLTRARELIETPSSPHDPRLMQIDYFLSASYQKAGQARESKEALRRTIANAKGDTPQSLAARKFEQRADKELKRP